MFVAPQEKEKAEAKYNLRALNELPYHLTVTENVDDLLEKALLNFEFIYYKLKATSFDRYTLFWRFCPVLFLG